MKNPSEYSKGPIGHMLDLRAAMGRLAITTREWCRAFDKGDMAAINRLIEQLKEDMIDIEAAGKGVNESAP